MPHMKPDGRNPARAARPATATALILLLGCLGLAACGSSSTSTTSTTAAAASATGPAATSTGAGTSSTGAPPASGPTGSGISRFKAIRECLQKNGITLPQRTPGTRPTPGAGGFPGGAGPALPKGVTRAQYEAALKKCGGRPLGGGASRLKNPVYQKALAKFATCMRENGVNVPQPNTSGTGPVFNIKGLNTASAQFKTAESKCSSQLQGAFRTRPGGVPPGGAGAAGAPAGPGA
jgi:hypothetical protein